MRQDIEKTHAGDWQALERWLGQPVAPELRNCLQQVGGASYGDSVWLYAIDDLLERNQTYEVLSYCPGWLTTGDDGGGRAVMVSLDPTRTGVFFVDHGSMAAECFEALADDLQHWVTQGCPLAQD